MHITRKPYLRPALDEGQLASPGPGGGGAGLRPAGPGPLYADRAEPAAPDLAPDLAPGDLATMAVLGIVNEGFGTLSQVVSAARSLARPDWQPTGEMLAGAVQAALADGLLTAQDTAQDTGRESTEPRLAILEAGLERLRALLRQPLARGRGSLGRTAAALKICFLGALDRTGGCAVIEDLSRSYGGELEALRLGRRACPAGGAFPCRWIDREIERIEQEVAWLQSLQAELRRGAASHWPSPGSPASTPAGSPEGTRAC